jgi:cytidine deaminase
MHAMLRTELDPMVQEALVAAESSLTHAHAPYSGLCVAAALYLEDGPAITGVNVESASFGLTLCAERSAIATAHGSGLAHAVKGIVLTARWTDPDETPPQLTPCGACRQWIAELSRLTGIDLPIYMFAAHANEGSTCSSSELLPQDFNESRLTKKPTS